MKTPTIIATIICILALLHTYAYSQLWKQYEDSAKVYKEQQKTDKAIEWYSKAKEALQKDSVGTNSYAASCNNLANLNMNMGQYDKAEPLFLEAKQIREQVLGKLHPDYASSCNNLAVLYYRKGQYDKAKPLYLEAKQIQEKVLGKLHPDYAASCNNLANLYRNLGQYDKAKPLYLEAKQIQEKVLGKLHPDYARSCTSLANLYLDMGQYDKAEPLYLEAKQIWEKEVGKEHRDYATSCNNLANFYMIMGQYDKAEPLFLEAKQIQEQVLGKLHPDYARSCNNLANLYLDMGQYDKAEPLFLEAKQIREKVLGKLHPDYARSCNNLANLYRDLGQYDKAEPLFLEAKQIREKVLGKQHRDYATSCNNLAILYEEMGQYDKAEQLYLEAKQIKEKVLGKLHPDYAASGDDLAVLYYIKGQYDKAEPLFLEAKQIREKVLGKQHPYYAGSCNNLANLYRNLGQYDKAEPLFLEAKQIQEQVLGKQHRDYAASCYGLANLYYNTGKAEQAYSFYAEAYRSQQLQVKEMFSFTSEAEQQSYIQLTTDLQHSFSSFSSLYPQYNHGLSYNMIIANRNLTLSSSQQLRNVMYTSNDTSTKKKYDNWMEVREQLAYWYAKPISERPDYFKDLEEQANTLEKELTRMSAAFQKQQAQNTTSWRDIQQALKPNEAVIEFSSFRLYNGKRWTDSTYYVALLLTKKLVEPQIIPLFEKKQLIYANYNKKALFYNTDQPVYTPYNLIWKPIEKHLQGITKVYFAPAGMLYTISLAAIPVNKHEVLSDKYELVQLTTTASVVNQSAYIINDTDKIDLYGGIQYEVDSTTLKQEVAVYHVRNENKVSLPADLQRGGGNWIFLPYTEKEVNEIENLSRQKNYNVAVVSGAAATEESIKTISGNGSPAVLHVATHGFFFPDPKESKQTNLQQQLGSGEVFKQSDNPLFRSGLLMAGASTAWNGKPIEGVEDGILTAYEVSNLYLPNTKLVVLSACETGLGDIQGNEGVYGLQRAFKMAGVKNLVMSLWKVSDKESSAFMQEFYKNMFAGQSISKAFYNTQTMMKNKYRNEYFKWAAWILVM